MDHPRFPSPLALPAPPYPQASSHLLARLFPGPCGVAHLSSVAGELNLDVVGLHRHHSVMISGRNATNSSRKAPVRRHSGSGVPGEREGGARVARALRRPRPEALLQDRGRVCAPYNLQGATVAISRDNPSHLCVDSDTRAGAARKIRAARLAAAPRARAADAGSEVPFEAARDAFARLVFAQCKHPIRSPSMGAHAGARKRTRSRAPTGARARAGVRDRFSPDAIRTSATSLLLRLLLPLYPSAQTFEGKNALEQPGASCSSRIRPRSRPPGRRLRRGCPRGRSHRGRTCRSCDRTDCGWARWCTSRSSPHRGHAARARARASPGPGEQSASMSGG